MEAGLRNQQQTTGLFCTDSTRTGDMFIGVFAEALVNNVTLPPRHWYVITISHERFDPSDLVSRLARPGCLAYGQWREYRILTSGTTDGTLDAQVNVPVTAIYIRRDAPPTEDLYDAVARWPLQRLAISGCEVDQPTVWYVAVTLERQWLADGRSPPLQQRRFQLTANLRQSNVSLMQMALGTRVSIPHNYLCCGVYRDFVVPELTRSLALRVEITVHEGSLSAIYLKHQTCARSPDDIGADESCIGRCQMQWLTTYDPFTLAPAYATAASVTVPMGIASADMRAAGGWYISIGSAFDGRVANFSLIAELVEAPVVDRFVPLDEDGAAAARCGRFCVVLDEDVTPIVDEDEDVIFGIGRSSSAPRRGSGSAGELLPVALALTAAIIVAWSGGVAAA